MSLHYDQNRWKILEESMRCSFLVKFEVFSLQLYYQTPLLVLFQYFFYFFSKKHLFCETFFVAVPFYVNCETRKLSRKPLKNIILENRHTKSWKP